MFFKLFVLFTLVPFIELALLIKIGTIIGTFNTLAIIIITGIVGAILAKMAGMNCILRIQQDLRAGIMPTEELLNGILILIAGVFLVTPGFITDTFGFLLLTPWGRKIVKGYLKRYFKKRLINGDFDISIF